MGFVALTVLVSCASCLKCCFLTGVEALTAALASVVGSDGGGGGDLATLMQTLAAYSGAGGQDMFALLAAAAGGAGAEMPGGEAETEAAQQEQHLGEAPAGFDAGIVAGSAQDDTPAVAEGEVAAAGASESQDAAAVAASLPLFHG